MSKKKILIVGAGAAGYFAAITAASNNPDAEVSLFEASKVPLSKVKISGGGRCNLTHHCFEPKELVKNYPRGSRELLGPFYTFQPQDTIDWFEARGVKTKTEADGRMFPVSDSSGSIISCLKNAARDAGVNVRLKNKVKLVTKQDDGSFLIASDEGEATFDAVVLATGSASIGHKIAASLGHSISELAPSLFTFEIEDQLIEGLAGISFENAKVVLSVEKAKFEQTGPVLITHWGLSGPAVLKLSAFAARELNRTKYQAKVRVSWIDVSYDDCVARLNQLKSDQPKKMIKRQDGFDITKRFWESILNRLLIDPEQQWNSVSKDSLKAIANTLTSYELEVSGKGVFKEEFVTCGGVELKEVNFKTMESKICQGLFFAGEILDIDGITGGFNFQNAWTTAWIAGSSIYI